jgi:hydroxyacid-oxoacid transhydrogenase
MTALPYNQRPAPDHPRMRPAYQGSNPISNIWASRAIEMISRRLFQVIEDPSDDEARGEVLLAATYAGIGFGNSGVHLAHGMSYPVSGMVRDYVPEGYPPGHPLVPHGMAVVLNAPAVFRFTASANPVQHLQAARLMGKDISGASPEDADQILAEAILEIMRKVGMPNGLSAVGYGPDDVDKLVEGTLPQHRVTKLSPRPVSAEDLKQLFLDSLELW